MSDAVTAGLFHVAVKTNHLAATVAFCTRVIGLVQVARPDFGYPSAWLSVPLPGGGAILHVYAGGPALGPEGRAPSGAAAIDHVSLACRGYHAFIGGSGPRRWAGASSWCLAPRSGSCSSTIPPAFSWN
ncbi:MAG TPA: hypothetical protein VGN83_16765 [Falsiroseomonas sp.]|jgi:catechol 2,3-dioxygenase-like lactoylglutathione lyase family enzyme|nr:hypothetical protein [Falsiroseomonas sp.]